MFAALLTGSCKKMLLGPDVVRSAPSVHASMFASVVDSLRYVYDLPALACAIVTDTGVVEAQVHGSRRYGGPANATVGDRFHLGSNTKAFTAVLIGTLVDEGLLTWETTMEELFPELGETMRQEYRTVTIRRVLSHSAGFVRDPSLVLHTATPREQRGEAAAWAFMQPAATTGGRFAYSNLGYIIAGAIAERLTGRQYEDLLTERVLRPLGITTGGFGPMGTPGLDDQPLQHTINHAPVIPGAESDLHPIYSPAGRLHLSIGDWAAYIRWILAVESGHASILRLETARMLTTGAAATDHASTYALGWDIFNRQWAGGRAINHGGCNGFNYSIAWLAPNKHFGVLAATNIAADRTPYAMEAIAGRLIDFHTRGR